MFGSGAAIAIVDLTQRSTEKEWLDSAEVSTAELNLVLHDLARFNGAMLGHQPVLAWLRRAFRAAQDNRPPVLVDVGCGYGDLLRAIRRWSRRRGIALKLIGLDLSAQTVAVARAATGADDEIDFQAADVFEYHPSHPIDFVVSSLLTHHFTDAMIVDFVRWMESNARRGWLIYDLQRHIVPYYFIGLIGRLTRLHRTVIHDGRISVARSLTRSEWERCIAAAGIKHDAVDLRWFLYRFVIGRLR